MALSTQSRPKHDCWHCLVVRSTLELHSTRQLLSDSVRGPKPYQFVNYSHPSTLSLQAHSSQLL